MKKLTSAVLLWMFVSAGVCLGQESQVRGWTKGKAGVGSGAKTMKWEL